MQGNCEACHVSLLRSFWHRSWPRPCRAGIV